MNLNGKEIMLLLMINLILLKIETNYSDILKIKENYIHKMVAGILRKTTYTLEIFPEDKTIQPIKGGFKFN